MRCINETKGVRCERPVTDGCMCAECWAAEDARTAVTAAEREVVEAAEAHVDTADGATQARLERAVGRLRAAKARLREVAGG